ncbi:MAG: CBS domain-containing protein [Aminipila sp.]
MSKVDIKKAPVVDGGKVVGIITRSDITHYLAKSYLEHEHKSVSA